MENRKLGIALAGLGNYATGMLAPALQETKECYLAGIVTGTPAKIPLWKEQYNIPDKNIYNYENFDAIKDNTAIDVIYIVLPNFMHAAYVIRAAQAGKHIICEKPMAISTAECDEMMAACKKAGVLLSIGYRLQYDPSHLEMVRLAKEKIYGKVKSIQSQFSFRAQKGIWRLNKKYSGGGPLMDIGIYLLQAAIYVMGEEPIAVTAQSSPVADKEKYIDVEETLDFQLAFPNGIIAECRTSYAENANFLHVEAEKGWFELKPAFNYNGLRLTTSDGKEMILPPFYQQAKQMDAMALAFKNKQQGKTPGEMGKRDMKYITAIYEAMRTGKRIEIK